MTFHRFVTPTYFGGMPVGYDLINVVSGGVGAGGSAFADGPKAGGNPNTGTYFVAWGEDATSSNANRGLRALAQNTDALDDLLHRDLAVAVRTNDVTPVAPVSSVILPTNTFLGTAGYTTSTSDLARLFSILDASDNEIIIQSTGQKVQVTSVTLGVGDAIGGGGANGSFSGNTVTLNISPSIPAGTTYRIWYGSRTNLAELPLDAFTTIKIRGAEEVPSEIENLFRLLHGNNLSWNASWTTTIWDLAASGFNERYNRSTATSFAAPEAYWETALDTAGAGGWLVRTGPGLTVYSDDTSGGYSDPANALFAAKFIDQAQNDTAGITGFVAYGSRRSGSAFTGESAYMPGAAMFLGLWPHHYTNLVHPTNPFTRIFEWAAASFSMVSGDEAIVNVTEAGNYWRTGGGMSSVALGYDMVECVYVLAGLSHREIYVIVSMGASNDAASTTKVRVRRLDGNPPNFSPGTTGTIRWISTSFAIGDGAGRYHKTKEGYADGESVMLDGLFYQVPPSLSVSNSDNNVTRVPAQFSARLIGNSSAALRWGGFQYTQPSGPVFAGELLGDGSLLATGAVITGTTTTQTLVAQGGAHQLGGTLGMTATVTRSGASGYTILRRTNRGTLGANSTVDLSADLFSFNDPSIASVDVELNISAASNCPIRCYSTEGTTVNTIRFRYSGITIATWPPGSKKPWIDFIYNGLLPEIVGYGGFTL